jgi:hypothetical protein
MLAGPSLFGLGYQIVIKTCAGATNWLTFQLSDFNLVVIDLSFVIVDFCSEIDDLCRITGNLSLEMVDLLLIRDGYLVHLQSQTLVLLR